MSKRYVYKDGLTAFALGVLVYIAVQLVLSFALIAAEEGSFWYWFILALGNVIIGAVAFAYAKLSKTSFLSATSLNVAPHFAHVLWGILATLGLMHAMIPLNGWICDLIEIIGLKRPTVDLPMQLAPLLIVASVIPAVSEELLFRGTIGNALSHGSTRYFKGALISGALFALFHMNPAQTIHQFALGCFLTVLVYRSGSVWTAVIVHLFNNVTTVLLSYFVEESGFYETNAIWLFFAGAVVFALATVGYFFTTKVNTKTVYFDEAASQSDSIEQENHLENSPATIENTAKSDFNVQEKALKGETQPIKGNMTVFIAAVAVCALLWIITLFG